MGTPYVGEIRMVGFNFAPQGWAFCDGSTLAISQNDVLFALIGTTYGGDGQNTFQLPNLQSRVPIHQGIGFAIGQTGGEENLTLTTGQIPAHNHAVLSANGVGNQGSPAGGTLATSVARQYTGAAPSSALNTGTVGVAGGSQPHDNMLPYLAVNYIISLFGVFPSRS